MTQKKAFLFIFYGIPAFISFFCSLFMLTFLYYNRKSSFTKQIFHSLAFFLSIGDLIQQGSWFIAIPNGDVDTPKCYAQKYIFQFGLLYKSFVSFMICATASYAFMYLKVPPSIWVGNGGFLCLIPALIVIIFSIYNQTSLIFCRYYPDNLPDAKTNETLALLITFIIPLWLSCILNGTCAIIMRYKVKGWYDINMNPQTANCIQIVQNMTVFCSIVALFDTLPAITSLSIYLNRNDSHVSRFSNTSLLIALVGLMNGSSGAVITIYYFQKHVTKVKLDEFLTWLRNDPLIETDTSLLPVAIDLRSSTSDWTIASNNNSSEVDKRGGDGDSETVRYTGNDDN